MEVPKITERNRFIMDGLKDCPQTELHSFILTIHLHRYPVKSSSKIQEQICLTIPIQVARLLQLKNCDKVLVAIKKATEEEVKEYEEKRT